MSKFNLDGSRNELRSDICMLQHDVAAMRECSAELKKAMSDDGMAGFLIAILFFIVWFIGYGMGKCS